MNMVASIRSASNALLSRAKWMSEAGLTFEGKRDLYTVLGYKKVLTLQDFRDRYERGGIAARIVEVLPNATWRGQGEIYEDEDVDKKTAFEKAWDELNKRLGIWSIFRRADILAGLGRYSVILLGAPGNLEDPLEKLKPDQLMYLQPFAEEDALITKFNTDMNDPRYGQPELYNLRRSNASAFGRVDFLRSVHWTRCIHIADGLLDDPLYGTPRLRAVWNYLDDLDKVSGGGAEAYWKRADQGLQIDIQPDTKFLEEDKEKLREQVEEYIHGLRRVLQTRGVNINTLGSDVAAMNTIDPILSLIASTIGVPQRILMGSERGELASSQDKTNFDDTVSDRRTSYAEPVVARQFVNRLIELGTLPTPKEYFVGWPDIDDMNDSQKADMAQKWAALNGAMGETVVKPNEIRDNVLGLPPFTEEELAEMEAEKQEKAQQEAEQKNDNLDQELTTRAKFEPKLEAAVQRSMAAAIRKGRRVLNSSALRQAIANKDRAAMARILAGATVEAKREMTNEVTRLL